MNEKEIKNIRAEWYECYLQDDPPEIMQKAANWWLSKFNEILLSKREEIGLKRKEKHDAMLHCNFDGFCDECLQVNVFNSALSVAQNIIYPEK